jgi:hypothetical protein
MHTLEHSPEGEEGEGRGTAAPVIVTWLGGRLLGLLPVSSGPGEVSGAEPAPTLQRAHTPVAWSTAGVRTTQMVRA